MFVRLRERETSLLMIDIQTRLLPSIAGYEAVRANARRLLQAAGVLSLPVIYTEQYPKGIGSTAEELVAVLPERTRYFEKTAFSCCDEPGFFDMFQDGEKFVTVIFGVESHICVLSTAMDLLSRGRKVVVAADACGSRNEDNHALALDALRSCGAGIVPTETVIYQLLGKAGTPEFKELLPLFK